MRGHSGCTLPPSRPPHPHPTPTKISNMCVTFFPGKPIPDIAGVFVRGWSHEHPLPSMYQNFRFPAGNQELSISHIVCANNLGTVNHLYHLGKGRNTLEMVLPRFSQGSVLYAGLSKDSALKLAMSTLSCTDTANTTVLCYVHS